MSTNEDILSALRARKTPPPVPPRQSNLIQHEERIQHEEQKNDQPKTEDPIAMLREELASYPERVRFQIEMDEDLRSRLDEFSRKHKVPASLALAAAFALLNDAPPEWEEKVVTKAKDDRERIKRIKWIKSKLKGL